MYYIQRLDGHQLETVDEFKTRKEARQMLREYQLSDRTAGYYISTRCCNAWKERAQHQGRRTACALLADQPTDDNKSVNQRDRCNLWVSQQHASQ